MTATNWIDRLSEYLDGTLTPEERSACEAWLASSAQGQALLQDLRLVVAKAKVLPDAPVPASVWAGVSAGIREQPLGRSTDRDVIPFDVPRRLAAPPSRRWQFTPLQFAVAAAVFIAVGTGIGFKVRAGPASQVANGPRTTPPVTTGTVFRPVDHPGVGADASYDKAVQEFQVLLERNRGSLDTATIRVLESSLARIDTALAEAQRALDGDPHSAYLNDHLSRIKRKKLDVLRQGASLVQAS